MSANLIDLRTVVLMTTVTGPAMGIVLFSAYASFPRDILGIREWACAMMAASAAAAMYGLRDVAPDWLTILVANATLFACFGLSLAGTQKFYGLPASWRTIALIGIVGTLGIIWWKWVTPDFSERVLLNAVIALAAYLAQAVIVVRRGARHFSTYFFGSLLTFQALLLLARAASALTGHVEDNLFAGSLFHTAYLSMSSFMYTLLPVGFMTVATRRLQTLLEERSNRDPLTGVLNRRGFADVYDHEIMRMHRSREPMALMCIDLDFFKSINDRFGHAVGDRVLVYTADTIKLALRKTDHVARFGGEEFIVLLPDTVAERALQVTERIRASLDEKHVDELPGCTASIGVAVQHSPDEGLDSLMSRADTALYQAKAGGRNRVEVVEKAIGKTTGGAVEMPAGANLH